MIDDLEEVGTACMCLSILKNLVADLIDNLTKGLVQLCNHFGYKYICILHLEIIPKFESLREIASEAIIEL